MNKTVNLVFPFQELILFDIVVKSDHTKYLTERFFSSCHISGENLASLPLYVDFSQLICLEIIESNILRYLTEHYVSDYSESSKTACFQSK